MDIIILCPLVHYIPCKIVYHIRLCLQQCKIHMAYIGFSQTIAILATVCSVVHLFPQLLMPIYQAQVALLLLNGPINSTSNWVIPHYIHLLHIYLAQDSTTSIDSYCGVMHVYIIICVYLNDILVLSLKTYVI